MTRKKFQLRGVLCQSLKGTALGAQVLKIRIGEIHSSATLVLFPKADQLVWVAIRKRPQKDAIDDTENGRVSTDADRESDYRDAGESRGLTQHANTVT